MCQLYASQDRSDYESVTRSLRLNGFSTSLRLEHRFWEAIDRIAAAEGFTTPQFLAKLHDEVMDLHGEVQNFTSLLRCICLIEAEGRVARSFPVAAE